MRFDLTEEQELLRDTFERFFRRESSPERVRAAEAAGGDPGLWSKLAELGALGLRAPEAVGGSDASLRDALLLMEPAGANLAPGPLAETLVVARLLAGLAEEQATSWAKRCVAGEAVVGLALKPTEKAARQLVAGGVAAQAVVGLDGNRIVLVTREQGAPEAVRDLGCSGLALWTMAGDGASPIVLADGPQACTAWRAAVAEWRLLMAAALNGLAKRALEIGAAYASERRQFDRLIGEFQGVAHPLANAAALAEASRLLTLWSVWSIAERQPEAAAAPAMALHLAAKAAAEASQRALHTHGGYGLSLEYDIQLYYRRAKAWPLVGGDPRALAAEATRKIWLTPDTLDLPDVGDPGVDFSYGPEGEAFAAATRSFFEANLTPELRAHARPTWEGHHRDVSRKLAEAGLLFPTWPKAYGGQERTPTEMAAMLEVFRDHNWDTQSIKTTNMVAQVLMVFASDEVKAQVLPRIAAGEALCSLGFSEPSSGSDIAGAQLRAVREDGGWRLNGQKMFTSGADIASYVLLLTRTDPQAAKHKGLTFFLVPLDAPGVEIQAVHTLSDERTNITYYTDVMIPDEWRLGEVDGGWKVLQTAMALEHSAGNYALNLRAMTGQAVAYCAKTQSGDARLLDGELAQSRLGAAYIDATAGIALSAYLVWSKQAGHHDLGTGPLTKLFQTEAYVERSADLMDLAAPDSLVTDGLDTGQIELGYRWSTASTTYGGSSEIMRSIVAQNHLGMPRSRS